jgi:ribonucleoside-diphosphate reductase alpha chain
MSDEQYIWYNEMSKQFLAQDYIPNQTLDSRVNIIAEAAGKTLKDPTFAERFIANMKKGWYSLSTPIWSNYGTDRGLPISCFGSYICDSMSSIFDTLSEVGIMTKYGGGTSGHFGNLRGRGANITDNGKSSGPVHFMQLFDSTMRVVSQGSLRRGSFAAYIPIEHPDIEEFLGIKGEGNPIQDLSFGVTVTDKFMQEMIAGDKDKREIWAKVIETRINTGYPYIIFIDTVNNNSPEIYKNYGKTIYASNLCTEIFLPSNELESFVCDLSSMNLLHYDEWKDTDAVQLLVQFLDAVMSEFIKKASKIKHFERAVTFAKNHRALGAGVLGWHSYLQKNMMPFESMEAKFRNIEIAKHIEKEAYHASVELANRFGAAPIFEGTNLIPRRNTTLCAIAPTKSSAFILGQASEGIEPHRSNYYIKDLAKGKFTIKNTQLEELLISKNQNTDEVWESILKNDGSVQHLDFLNHNEKLVFKTFVEISPKELIIQAGARQKYIDQGQSLNLMIHPSTPIKDINALYVLAWELGVKSLYYQISVNAAQQLSKSILDCVSCS